ncbi:protein-lysine N-methyltransferase EEF2KMT [Tetranychus urticae]|uniref:FAM86 N-terminal domain-containing protein n=1 Tax=Tetranychus urticae TaxID=32264 RepID=T1KMT0_TETUR|nr:protein-lysine N-methyltransferase EEF2KMT [Tetranychus urticae]
METLDKITQLYLSRAAISKILDSIDSNLNEGGLSECDQVKLLKLTILHEVAIKFPACLKYRSLFLKKLIALLESRNIEIAEAIYVNYTNLIANNQEKDINYTSYLIKGQVITVEDTDSLVEEGTTGLHCWEAGKQFISFALSHQHLFENKTILELGSGVGLTGIAISKLINPSFFYFTDCDPQVLSLIQRNIDINKCSNCKVLPFLWKDENDSKCLDTIKPDLIIGSDLVYDPIIISDLLDVINRSNRLKLSMIFLFTDRKTDVLSQFEKALNSNKDLHWEVEILLMDKDLFFDHSSTEFKFHLYKINV